MSATVKCSSEFRDSDNEQLTIGPALWDFITRLPQGASLSPITVDKGSQRDPWVVLVGLRATWEEAR